MALNTTTYPFGCALPGRVYSELGITVEIFQGYAQIPTVPTPSVVLLDVASPDPNNPVPLSIVSSATNIRQIMGFSGGLVGPGSITLASTGGLRVGLSAFALTSDVTGLNTGVTSGAMLRQINTGALVTGTVISSANDGCFQAGGFAFSGAGTTVLRGGITDTVTLYGCNNDSATASSVNFSATPGSPKPPIVLVTIFTAIKRYKDTQLADYPSLPPNVLRLLA